MVTVKVADAQPFTPAAPARTEAVALFDHREGQPRVRSRQAPRVPFRRRRRHATFALQEQTDLHFAPALPGVNAGAVGLKLDVADRLAERLLRGLGGPLPLGDLLAFPLPGGSNLARADRQSAELLQMFFRAGERPTGGRQSQQPTRLRRDEFGNAQTRIQRVFARQAGVTRKVHARQGLLSAKCVEITKARE